MKLTLLTGALVASAGCGTDAFRVSPSSQAQAAGNYQIAPKVDLLLAEDDSQSISEIYPQVSSQVRNLLNQLQNQNWDYHFATIPLTTPRAINQIVASKQDANWGSLWTPAYPGAVQFGPGTVTPGFFATPDAYSEFLTLQDVNSNANGGGEPGFQTILSALQNQVQPSGFLRSDALLVILVVGNGNDTSGVALCTRFDGVTGPCELVGFPQYGTMNSSFANYKAAFQKINPQAKLYATVANRQGYGCLSSSSRSYIGARYQLMAAALGGQAYDICSTPIATALSAMATNLQTTKLAFKSHYILLNSRPDPKTIKVTKFVNGNAGQAVPIPQDPSNGWSYTDTPTDGCVIDYPTPMNCFTGKYVVALNGSAELVGDDTAQVDYTPLGAHDHAGP